MNLGLTSDPGVHRAHRAVLGDQPQSSMNPKILLTKVVGYDSQIIKIPLICGSSYFVVSRELLSETIALPLTPT